MIKQYKLAMIGFGNVGQGFAQALAAKGELLRTRFGVDIRIVAVSDTLKGSVADADGLAPQALLDAIRRDGNLSSVAAAHRGWNARQTIDHSEADILVELGYTDLDTGEPALSHVKQAPAAMWKATMPPPKS